MGKAYDLCFLRGEIPFRVHVFLVGLLIRHALRACHLPSQGKALTVCFSFSAIRTVNP